METKNMPDSQWNNPKPVTDIDLDLAFPVHVIDSYVARLGNHNKVGDSLSTRS